MTANIITLARIAIIPFFMFFLMLGDPRSRYIALALFIIASVTDFLDGYIARKYNQITDFGKFIDPLADKLLVTSALMYFAGINQMSWVLVFVILAREFMVTGLRTVAMSKGTVMAASMSGKVKTVIQIVAIVIMLTDFAFFQVGGIIVNDICIWAMVLVTVYSGYDYIKSNFNVIAQGIVKK